MSLASRTRDTVKKYPCIHEALRTGVINYSAAARFLPVSGDTEAIASALRRYAEELPDPTPKPRDISITMHTSYPDQLTGLPAEIPEPSDEGPVTWLCVSGDITPVLVGSVLLGCKIHEIPVLAVTATDGTAVLSVPRSAGAAALRCMENVIDPASN